jgi:mRNA interferase YafQ
MRTIARTSQFKRDYKREQKGKYRVNLDAELLPVLNSLANDLPLEKHYFDHGLSGEWDDHRDCHIKPDLVLIYQKEDNTLRLVRLGSHSELGI